MKGRLFKTDSEIGYALAIQPCQISNKLKELPHLSRKNCEAIANGYDLDELYLKHYLEVVTPNVSKWSFFEGAKAILEILGDKNKELYEFVRDCAQNWDCDEDSHRYDTPCRACEADSLKKLTEWDVEIVMEELPYSSELSEEEIKDLEIHVPQNTAQIKLDSTGCLILKRI